MTPSLAAVYDSLVEAAAAPAFAPIVAEHRTRFETRVGPFAPSDPWFEERSAALWDRVLIDPRVHRALATDVPFGRAQRGLFEVEAGPHGIDLVCVVRGAAFRLAKSDQAVGTLVRGGGWIDGHVVPTSEGVALLPGLLVHPAEASEPMRELVGTGLPFEELLDELLGMRHRLAARSRMKARQVYRVGGLVRSA